MIIIHLYVITYNPKRKNQFAGITDMRAEVMDLYPCLLLLCMVTVYVTFAQQPSDEDWLELDTPQGPVRGRRDPETELYVFYNIPYATAPVKENKYKVFEKKISNAALQLSIVQDILSNREQNFT